MNNFMDIGFDREEERPVRICLTIISLIVTAVILLDFYNVIQIGWLK